MLTTSQTSILHDAAAAPKLTTDGSDPCGARLAAEVRDALRAASYVPEDAVDLEVRHHAVYLSGTVKWEHQRVAAERAVENLPGVHAFKNGIRVTPRASATEIRERIIAALNYGKSASHHRIDVDVDDESVTLSGAVACYTDRQLAERTALSVPHVRSVCNRLRVVRT